MGSGASSMRAGREDEVTTSAKLGVQLGLTVCEAAWSVAAGPNGAATSASAGVSDAPPVRVGAWSRGAEVVVEETASARAGALYAAQVRASSAGGEESTSSGTFSSETRGSVTTGRTV